MLCSFSEFCFFMLLSQFGHSSCCIPMLPFYFMHFIHVTISMQCCLTLSLTCNAPYYYFILMPDSSLLIKEKMLPLNSLIDPFFCGILIWWQMILFINESTGIKLLNILTRSSMLGSFQPIFIH